MEPGAVPWCNGFAHTAPRIVHDQQGCAMSTPATDCVLFVRETLPRNLAILHSRI
jgi:hypothetical protein